MMVTKITIVASLIGFLVGYLSSQIKSAPPRPQHTSINIVCPQMSKDTHDAVIASLKAEIELLKNVAESDTDLARCATVLHGNPRNPCHVAMPWSDPLPTSFADWPFEGTKLPRSIYNPQHPFPPTKYKPPRRVSAMLRILGIEFSDALFGLVSNVKDAVIVEVGAYDGTITKQMASQNNVKKVYSFEPTPSKVATIKSNFAPVKHKVKFTNAAISNYTGSATFYVPYGDTGSAEDSLANQKYHTGNAQAIEVPVLRLDDVVKEHVDFLVTDTQGNELHVLLGAEKLIDQYGIDFIQLEYIPKMSAANGENLGDALHFLHDKGYVCFDPHPGISTGATPLNVDTNREYSHFPYLYATKNNIDFVGTFNDLLCMKVR
jgi:FkbM family methyltransferase